MSDVAQKKASTSVLLDVYRYMRMARSLDELEQDFTRRGAAFFHVSAAGHEASAALHPHLTADDWLHCHYRDKALMLARGVSAEMFFLGLFCKDGSHSRGRQMSAHISDPARHVMSIVGPVGGSGLQAAGVAEAVKDDPSRPIVYCSVGDGTTQEGEMLEAIGVAAARELPVLFVVQDNSFAISTRTRQRTFYSLPSGEAETFYNIPIQRIDGRSAAACYERFGEIVAEMRETRRPAIVVLQVERLDNHTNADDQTIYRSQDEIERVRKTSDPITICEAALLEAGVEQTRLDALVDEVTETVKRQALRAQRAADPYPTFYAKKEIPRDLEDSRGEYRGDHDEPRLVMLEALRAVIRHQMERNGAVTLFGEDIEDPKGDVFGVTRGLSGAFPGRVINSPLSESTILGFSIGQALAGRRPVAFLQFADFLPLAYNQIFAELGSMHWRTDGAWQAPVIVMITCGGYKPGLGPFHASSMEAIALHTPGIDVFMPSTAADAAGLLNAAFLSGRPTLFFYPKNLLNDRENATSADVDRQLVPIGKARVRQSGDDITFVAWGNTVPLCLKAAAVLRAEGFSSDVIDLRSLSPWDEEAVLASVERTGRLIVVHEDNQTCGFGAEVISTVMEQTRVPVLVRRVVRPDTYVPCNFGNQLEVLPSYKRILENALEMLGATVTWQAPPRRERGIFLVEAIGSSPSDESVTVLDWQVEAGDTIEAGAIVANLEADKAVTELSSPVPGEVLEFLVDEGEMVKVGTPILRLKTDEANIPMKPISREEPGTPVIKRTGRAPTAAAAAPPPAAAASATTASVLAASVPVKVEIGIVGVTVATGSRKVSNAEIAKKCPGWKAADILKRVGIESRYWVADGEDTVSLGEKAARDLLTASGLTIRDIDLIIVTTGTPPTTTPSTAGIILHRLSDGADDVYVQAHDINAACTGYLYGLQAAYDYLNTRPDNKVMLITSETLSRKLDVTDSSTAPIFGDAATATLLVVGGNAARIRARLWPPALAAKGEDGSILAVPSQDDQTIFMDGPKVFVEAINGMIMMLDRALQAAGKTVDDLDLIVPHQANQRIINAIGLKLRAKEKMYSNIRHYGNTSSSTIPICLERLLEERKSGELLGLAAFGGGFTIGGAVLQIV